MFAGITRFTDFQRSLDIAPNVLAKRLGEFVGAGIFELRPGSGGSRTEYVLTRKGRELQPIIVALTEWGNRWADQDDNPITFEHEGCGGQVALRMECSCCDGQPSPVEVKRGPVGPGEPTSQQKARPG